MGILLLHTPAAHALPPGAPELVAPAPGHVFAPTDVQVFTLRATDPEGDQWLGVIEVTNLDTGRISVFSTPPGNSGEFAGTVATPPLTPGQYRWRAHAVDTTASVGAWSASADFRVGSNQAPGSPTLLVPADGANLHRMGNEPFSISAVDGDGDPFSGTVVIRRNGVEVLRFPTSPTPSGGVSWGLPLEPLREGDYTWTAEATDVHGAPSGPSSSRSFSVGPPATAGGGGVAGTVTYASPGVPLGVCEPLASSFTLASAAAVFNTAIVGFVGPVELRGTGTSACESVQFASGNLTLDITDSGTNDSTLICEDLDGTYTRIGTSLVLLLTGGCIVNDFPISGIELSATLQFAPVDIPDNLSGRVENAAVGGAFVVHPA